jgi:hypothetical protein
VLEVLTRAQISTEVDVHIDSSHVELDAKRLHFLGKTHEPTKSTQSWGSCEEKLEV